MEILTALILLALAIAVGIALAPYVLSFLGGTALVLFVGVVIVALLWLITRGAGLAARLIDALFLSYFNAIDQAWQNLVDPSRDVATRIEALLTLISLLVLPLGIVALVVANRFAH